MLWKKRDGTPVRATQFKSGYLLPKGAEQEWDRSGCYYTVTIKGGAKATLTEGDFVVLDLEGEVLDVMPERDFQMEHIGEPEPERPAVVKSEGPVRPPTSRELRMPPSPEIVSPGQAPTPKPPKQKEAFEEV